MIKGFVGRCTCKCYVCVLWICSFLICTYRAVTRYLPGYPTYAYTCPAAPLHNL